MCVEQRHQRIDLADRGREITREFGRIKLEYTTLISQCGSEVCAILFPFL